jgi:phosphatidylserine/phosphatidylglycerophosphate/cardiolipin synthase-like enzyme
MAVRGVMGRVIFADTGQGVPDLEVNVVDVFPIPDNDLGTTTTTATGDFELAFSPDDYSRWEPGRAPDLRVRIYGPVRRQLFDRIFKAVLDDVLDLTGEPILIHSNNVGVQDPVNEPNSKAWLVTNATLHLENGDPFNLSEGNTFESLIDGAELFPKVTAAVKAADISIHFMNMNFRIGKDLKAMRKGDRLITNFIPDPPPLNQRVAGEQIHEIMKTKADVDHQAVRVVVADIPMATDDAVRQVKEFFTNTTVETRVAEYGLPVLHGRTVIVDGATAFVIGSSFDQSYFSSSNHDINDRRHRGSLLHDVAAEVTGPAVAPIDETFITVWNQTNPDATPETPRTRFTGSGEVAMQVLRTLPGGKFDSPFPGALPLHHGETGVLEAYQRAIARAETYIYIEDQYFTNSAIVDALILRMNQVDTLQLILVVNIKPDVNGYPRKQVRNIRMMQEKISNHKLRFRVFTLWSTQFSTEPNRARPFEIMNINLHSKVGIIDDKWATIGTANLDGSGLNYIEVGDVASWALSEVRNSLLEIFVVLVESAFILWLLLILGPLWVVLALLGTIIAAIGGVLLYKLITNDDSGQVKAIFEESIANLQLTTQHANPFQEVQPSRHVELNVVLYNGVAGLPATDSIKKFREKLWSEHLGLDPSGSFPSEPTTPNDPDDPTVGWLQLWTSAAKAKLTNIKTNAQLQPGQTGTTIPGALLEWQPHSDPKPYLKAHGVDEADRKNFRITVRTKADIFNFEKGVFQKNDL